MNKENLKYYCKECKIDICSHTALYGSGLCHSCANTGKRNGMYDIHRYGELNPNFNNHKLAGEKNPRFGTTCSPETIEKMRNAKLDIYKGSNNPNWKGGIGRLPYNHDFYKLRHTIWDRDNHTCQKCGTKIEEYLAEFKALLTVHHIDYDKLNDILTNLITLCRKCNSEVNADRDYWYAYFTYILTEGLLQ